MQTQEVAGLLINDSNNSQQQTKLQAIIEKLIVGNYHYINTIEHDKIFQKNDIDCQEKNLNFWCEDNFFEVEKLDGLGYKISKREYFRDSSAITQEKFNFEDFSIYKEAFKKISNKIFPRSMQIIQVSYFHKGAGQMIVYFSRIFKNSIHSNHIIDYFSPIAIHRISV